MEFPYFLVGHKAIDREIKSIEDRPDTDTLLTSYNYNITKQELIKIDSVTVSDPTVISPVFLAAYIGLKNGSFYNQRKINLINKSIFEVW